MGMTQPMYTLATRIATAFSRTKPREFKISDDRLQQWNEFLLQVHPRVYRLSPPPVGTAIPDISGDWFRAVRIMECRNPSEKPGRQTSVNPKGSIREVNPPDIDRNASKLAGRDIARPLHWMIAKNETAGGYTGGGPGSVHDHNSVISYRGIADDKHQFSYVTTRSTDHTYKYYASRVVMSIINKRLNREKVSTQMFGFIIVGNDNDGNMELTSIVTRTDGKDRDLPKRFREVSVWKKAVPVVTPA